jgi:cbb3-type cytochrome oxidase subunit 3
VKLSDVLGHLDLTVWPKMALVLFLGVFAAVTWRALRAKRAAVEHAAGLPLEE